MALPLRALSRSSLRAAASGAPSVAAVARRRALHSLPSLPLPLRFTGASSSSDRACEPLFSRRTLDLIWEHYQRRLLARLNDLVRGTEYENSSLVETVIGSASNPSQILIFNTASQALNNAFFFHGLKPKELGTAPGVAWDQLPQPEPPKALLDRIETQWGSFAAFKDAFSATATGMSASGWVWLVRDQQGNLGIVPTHGAGTVLVQNRVQKNLGSTFEASVGIDAQGNPLPEAAAQRPQQQGRAASTSPFAAAPARSFSSSSAAASTYASAQRAFGQQPNDSKVGETLQPLLCLSVHEHAWLPDHGFEQDVYLQRFWECVNWTRVANLWDHGEAVYSD